MESENVETGEVCEQDVGRNATIKSLIMMTMPG